jgi:type IV pilus assembly protein PilB
MGDMGIEPFMVAAAIDCVVAQRLARTLCHHCKQVVEMPQSLREEYGLEDVDLFEAEGCIRCGQTGYRGRTGLFEVVPMTDGLRELVLEKASVAEFTRLATEEGMRSMRDDGIAKVREGLTTLTEVARVTAML